MYGYTKIDFLRTGYYFYNSLIIKHFFDTYYEGCRLGNLFFMKEKEIFGIVFIFRICLWKV